MEYQTQSLTLKCHKHLVFVWPLSLMPYISNIWKKRKHPHQLFNDSTAMLPITFPLTKLFF